MMLLIGSKIEHLPVLRKSKFKVQYYLQVSDAGNPFPEAMANYETFHFLKGM